MLKEFKTTDLGLACFLSTKFVKLKAIERDPECTYEKPRGIFVFLDNGGCEELKRCYESHDSSSRQVDARRHFYEVKKLKNTLYYNLGFLKK